MGFHRRSKAVVVMIALWASSASAQIQLRNDSFQMGDTVGYQVGFVAGEAAAVTLTSGNPSSKLTAVRFLFGGATTTHTVTLTIYEDAAGTTPGAVIFTGDYQVTGADNTMHELDLSADNVMVGPSFRVAIGFQHAGAPSVARDDSGLTPNVNFLNLQGVGWIGSASAGVTGDWIIRAVVTPMAADAGSDAGLPDADAGSTDAGSTDAGSTDAGSTDAGSTDAGSTDAGSTDAGFTDAGLPDAGGTPDAGGGADAGTSSGMCTANTDCVVGSYCDLTTRRCTFDCRAAADCGSNMSCSSLGKCVGDTKPAGCGCSSLEWAVASLALLLVARRRR